MSLAPMKRGFCEPAEAGEQAEHRARRRDGSDQRDDGADQQHQGEALDPGGRDREQDQRGDRRDDVCVEDRPEALRVARRRSPRARTCPARDSSLMRSKTTTFASAATPIVRINPAKPGSVSVTPKSTIAAYMNARVDREADDCDDAEEAVEHEQEQRDQDQAADRGVARLLRSESLPSVAETSVRSSGTKLTGSAPVCRTSARSFASLKLAGR